MNNINKLKEEIEKRIKKEKEKIKKDSSEYSFADKFLTKYRIDKNSDDEFLIIYDLLKIDYYDLFLAMMYSQDNIFNEIEKYKKEIKDFFDTAPIGMIFNITGVLESTNNEISDKLGASYADVFRDVDDIETRVSEKINEIHSKNDEIRKKYIASYIFGDIYMIYKTDILKYINLIADLRFVKTLVDEMNDTLMYIEEDEKLNVHEKKEIAIHRIKDYFEDKGSQDVIVEVAKDTFKTLENFVTDKTRNNKKVNKQIQDLVQLQRFVDKIDISKPISIDEKLFKKNKNSDLKNIVLKEIYLHNLEITESTKKAYDLLLSESSEYSVLFNKYGIDINSYDINLDKYNRNDIKDMLKNFYEIDLNEQQILYILSITSKDTVNKIYDYLKKGFIDKEFIDNYINIFNKDKKDFHKNIELLNNNNVSQSNIFSNKKVLLADNNIVYKNINKINKYKLDINNTSNLNFLTEHNINKKIDKLLELGFESELVNGLDILNYSLEDIKKIELLKIINPGISINEIYKFIDNENFYIENADDYICNYLEFEQFSDDEVYSEEDLIKMLSKCESNSSRTYNIGNVLVSKNKVKRNINKYKKITKQSVYELLFNGINIDVESFTMIDHELFDNKQLVK